MRSTASWAICCVAAATAATFFARETDHVIREDGHVPDTASDAPAPQLFPGDDGPDTLQTLGPGSYLFA